MQLIIIVVICHLRCQCAHTILLTFVRKVHIDNGLFFMRRLFHLVSIELYFERLIILCTALKKGAFFSNLVSILINVLTIKKSDFRLYLSYTIAGYYHRFLSLLYKYSRDYIFPRSTPIKK